MIQPAIFHLITIPNPNLFVLLGTGTCHTLINSLGLIRDFLDAKHRQTYVLAAINSVRFITYYMFIFLMASLPKRGKLTRLEFCFRHVTFSMRLISLKICLVFFIHHHQLKPFLIHIIRYLTDLRMSNIFVKFILVFFYRYVQFQCRAKNATKGA